MKKPNNKESGFISIILIIVVCLVLLKYIYDIDIVKTLTTGKFREVLDYVYSWGQEGWDKYRDIIIIGWNYAVELIQELLSKIKK